MHRSRSSLRRDELGVGGKWLVAAMAVLAFEGTVGGAGAAEVSPRMQGSWTT